MQRVEKSNKSLRLEDDRNKATLQRVERKVKEEGDDLDGTRKLSFQSDFNLSSSVS